MSIFDNKHFNGEVFARYMETVPRIKQNALLKAGVLRVRSDLKTLLVDQTGGNYITVPMAGRLSGTPVNYDGGTDIEAKGIDSYVQGMVVVGRADAWGEKDFTYDITGHDFMENIAAQVGDYWDDVDQTTMLAILKGIFSMTTKDGGFVNAHTLDISTLESGNTVDATTLNNALQKAAGAKKNIYKAVVMHSQVATNLENMKLLQYAKGTDANGMERDMTMATWNGRTVLIDDDVPVTTVGGKPAYTTYLLGEGAFDYCDCGAKVPYEVQRDAKTDGGIDTLYTRQRKLFAPRGISYVKPNVTSPTDEMLETGANWNLVNDGATSNAKYIPHKAIPIARIISLG